MNNGKTMCRICQQALEKESPQSTRQYNPLTFRIAWMHQDCFADALWDIWDIPAKSEAYETRLDEYDLLPDSF